MVELTEIRTTAGRATIVARELEWLANDKGRENRQN